MSDIDAQKPALVIDLAGPEGNVFALVANACGTLEGWGHVEQSKELRAWFGALWPQGSGVTYDDVRRMVERYCDVTWLNEESVPPQPQME